MPEMCEWPRCKRKADYGNMDVCADDCCEELMGVVLCRVHANVTLNLNDDKDEWEFSQLSKQEKKAVNNCIYRLRHSNMAVMALE